MPADDTEDDVTAAEAGDTRVVDVPREERIRKTAMFKTAGEMIDLSKYNSFNEAAIEVTELAQKLDEQFTSWLTGGDSA